MTKRELVLIAEDTASSSIKVAAPKSGGTITYFLLVRLVDFHVAHQERFSIFSFEVHARHGGEKLEIIFPSGHEKSVSKAMQQVSS